MITKMELGTATICPETAYAGQRGQWTIHYQVGKTGIKQGGSLRIILPTTGLVRWETGKVLAFCNNPGASLEVQTEKTFPMSYHHSHYPAITVRIWGTNLKAGDKIKIQIGALGGYLSGRFIQARAQKHTGKTCFRVFVDPKGNSGFSRERIRAGTYQEISGNLTMTVKPAREVKIRCVVRNRPAPDKDCIGIAGIEDEFENPITEPDFPIRLFVEHGNATVPDNIQKIKNRLGTKFKLKNPGGETTWLGASCWQKNIYGISNPICPGFNRKGHEIYFGDTHVMTEKSCGSGDPEDALKYARDVFGLDFTTVSDTSDLSYWTGHQKLFKKYNKDHEFITLPGYERGFSTGHKNVYYLDENLPAYSGKNLKELWKFLKGKECLVISHHPNIHSETDPDECRGPLEISSINPKHEKLIEICQNRGPFEKDEVGEETIFGGFGSSIRDVLKQGYRLGFVGGTDTHRARPGSPRSNQSGIDSAAARVTGGITAVLCKELTRESIWKALLTRRCYATTSVRILLDFELNNHQMGEDIKLTSNKKNDYKVRKLYVRAAGTAEIDRIVVVRNGMEIHEIPISDMETKIEWEDKKKLTTVHDRNIGGVYYYVKIYQVDGNMAWSSPIWLSY